MLRLLIDNDFNQIILRGLLRRVSDLDAVTAYEVGLSEASEPELLGWAVEEKRVVVTHDRRTMPYHAATRMHQGKRVAGELISSRLHSENPHFAIRNRRVVSRRLPVSAVIDDLEIIVSCSSENEWENVIKHLPL